MLSMSGSALVARRAGLRVPAADQALERRVRCMVANPWAKASGWSLTRAMNLLIVASEATDPNNAGAARNWSISVTCSPPPASITARDPRILPGRCTAVAGTNWEKRSSHRFRKPRALRKPVSIPKPAWDTKAWSVGDAGTIGKAGVELFTAKVTL